MRPRVGLRPRARGFSLRSGDDDPSLQALYGEHPFMGDGVGELLDNLESGRVREPPSRSSVPLWLHEIVLRGLSVSPSDRFASIDALVAALDQGQRGARRRASRALGIGAAALAAMLIAFASEPGPIEYAASIMILSPIVANALRHAVAAPLFAAVVAGFGVAARGVRARAFGGLSLLSIGSLAVGGASMGFVSDGRAGVAEGGVAARGGFAHCRAGRVRTGDHVMVPAPTSWVRPEADPAGRETEQTQTRLPMPPVDTLDLTSTGALVGTPAYMAPEQFAGHPADARSGQYSLCATFWELLYGQRPFEDESPPRIAAATRRCPRTGLFT